jgi:glycosyltransferase involved in cell wall biosynthesis
MKRILYFSRDYSTHDHRFLTALAKTGLQVYYLRLEKRGHSLEDRPVPAEIEQVHWAGGETPARLRDGVELLFNLKRVLRKIQPDLVHAGPIQTAAFLTALAGYQPLVSMSWGYDLLVDAPQNSLWRWVTRYTLRHSAVLVGDCQTIRQAAISFGMPNERIVTFPWGVDLQHFSPDPDQDQPPSVRSRLGWGEDVFILLSTRSWESIYGVETLAEAFVRAAKDLPQLRLIMLGNGSLAKKLRQIFSQGNALEQVYFPGQVKQRDLPKYYRSADLYISASRSDGTSISLLEALACGCPALLSDIPGNREWITPGEQGWFFRDGDPASLADAIRNTVNKRQQLPEMRRSARLLAEQRADWEKNFTELLKAYHLAGFG